MVQKVELSFEFFPPRTEKGEEKLKETSQILSEFSPSFYSVTFGAGGATQEKTTNTVAALCDNLDTKSIAPHISCMNISRERIDELLATYQSLGLKRLVVLRGDLPSGLAKSYSEFTYANQLVRYIRETTGDHFHLEVAAYPEKHPESSTLAKDLSHFKQKVESGANSAITQYFYNPESYFYFLEDAAKLSVTLPIIPGIMPITNYDGLLRFSKLCDAELPRWLLTRLDAYKDDPVSLKAFGYDVVLNLCEKLIAGGAPGLHFYTLNQAEPTMAICQALR